MDNRETKPESIDVGQTGVTAEERHHLIAEEAYFRAEHRGFTPGAELQDWLEAEAKIETMHGKTRTETQSKDA
jgi:hypothetical protein